MEDDDKEEEDSVVVRKKKKTAQAEEDAEATEEEDEQEESAADKKARKKKRKEKKKLKKQSKQKGHEKKKKKPKSPDVEEAIEEEIGPEPATQQLQVVPKFDDGPLTRKYLDFLSDRMDSTPEIEEALAEFLFYLDVIRQGQLKQQTILAEKALETKDCAFGKAIGELERKLRVSSTELSQSQRPKAKRIVFGRSLLSSRDICGTNTQDDYFDSILRAFAASLEKENIAGTLVEYQHVPSNGVRLCVRLNYGSFLRLPLPDEHKSHQMIAFKLALECFGSQAQVGNARMCIAMSYPRLKYANNNPAEIIPMLRTCTHLIWPNISVWNIEILQRFFITLDMRIANETPFFSNCVDKSITNTAKQTVHLLTLFSHKIKSCTTCKSKRPSNPMDHKFMDYESSFDEEDEALQQRNLGSNVRLPLNKIAPQAPNTNFVLPHEKVTQHFHQTLQQQMQLNNMLSTRSDSLPPPPSKQSCADCFHQSGKQLSSVSFLPEGCVYLKDNEPYYDQTFFVEASLLETLVQCSIVNQKPIGECQDFEAPADAPNATDIFGPNITSGDFDESKLEIFYKDEIPAMKAIEKDLGKSFKKFRPTDDPLLFSICSRVIRLVGNANTARAKFKEQKQNQAAARAYQRFVEGRQDENEDKEEEEQEELPPERGVYDFLNAVNISVSYSTKAIYVYVQGLNQKHCIVGNCVHESMRVHFVIDLREQKSEVRQECAFPACRQLILCHREWQKFNANAAKEPSKRQVIKKPQRELDEYEMLYLQQATHLITMESDYLPMLHKALKMPFLGSELPKIQLFPNGQVNNETALQLCQYDQYLDPQVRLLLPLKFRSATFEEKEEYLKKKTGSAAYIAVQNQLNGISQNPAALQEAKAKKDWFFATTPIETDTAELQKISKMLETGIDWSLPVSIHLDK
jgi:hypothetical protein